jgi:hypothetical protein
LNREDGAVLTEQWFLGRANEISCKARSAEYVEEGEKQAYECIKAKLGRSQKSRKEYPPNNIASIRKQLSHAERSSSARSFVH